MMYSETTNNITVEVFPSFIPERSSPEEGFFFYAYHVKITNVGEKECKVLGRHWIIKDGLGHEEHVVGDGVVGEQPVIAPQTSYEYTSFCPLPTPTGNMRGTYEIETVDNSKVKIKIPLFFLRADSSERSQLN